AKAHRFLALRYDKAARKKKNDKKKNKKTSDAKEAEQYQLFDTAPYEYRVFVTNSKGSIAFLTWFYRQRAGAENLIKEANNDPGLTAYPSDRFNMNPIHFQLAMVAYNLNAWLLSRSRDNNHNAESPIMPSGPGKPLALVLDCGNPGTT